MEKECTRCKTRFYATTESQSICPECIAAEFGEAVNAAPEEVKPEVVFHRRLKKRQEARAERMQRQLASGAMFSSKQKVLGCLAGVLFCVSSFVFMLGDSESYKTPISQLEIEYQLMVSIGCGLVSVLCLLPSFRSNRVVVSALMVLILAWSVAVPFVWHIRVPESAEISVPVSVGTADDKEKPVIGKGGATLSEGDLEVFRTVCAESPRQVHFAIYMDNQTSSSRTLIRESLTRLLQAEYTRAYTRGRGALFVVVNARVSRSKLPLILARYGQLSYSRADSGIYELHFSAERAKLVRGSE